MLVVERSVYVGERKRHGKNAQKTEVFREFKYRSHARGRSHRNFRNEVC